MAVTHSGGDDEALLDSFTTTKTSLGPFFFLYKSNVTCSTKVGDGPELCRANTDEQKGGSDITC